MSSRGTFRRNPVQATQPVLKSDHPRHPLDLVQICLAGFRSVGSGTQMETLLHVLSWETLSFLRVGLAVY